MNATDRRGEIVALNDVRGALKGAAAEVPPVPRRARRHAVDTARDAVAGTRVASSQGWASRLARPRPNSVRRLGGGDRLVLDLLLPRLLP